MSKSAPWPTFVVAGAVIRLLLGLFGVGGSSVSDARSLAARRPRPGGGRCPRSSPGPSWPPARTCGAATPTAPPHRHCSEVYRRRSSTASLSQAIGAPGLLIASGVVLVIVGIQCSDPSPRPPAHRNDTSTEPPVPRHHRGRRRTVHGAAHQRRRPPPCPPLFGLRTQPPPLPLPPPLTSPHSSPPPPRPPPPQHRRQSPRRPNRSPTQQPAFGWFLISAASFSLYRHVHG